MNLYVNDLVHDYITFLDRNEPYGSYKDSIYLPYQLREDLFKNLGLIHDLETPVTDSLFRTLDLAPNYGYILEDFILLLDHNEDWVQNLQQGISPTGNDLYDEYAQLYGLEVTDVRNNKEFTFNYNLSMNINPIGLGNTMKSNVPGVFGNILTHYNYPDDKGDKIKFDITLDIMKISITIGYDNCENGCQNLTTWVFDCYPDCDVEYVDRIDD